jgi:hypothetical protein
MLGIAAIPIMTSAKGAACAYDRLLWYAQN